ncbi:Protein of unknown function DUF2458 [Penicillium expansum]|uniref:Uncharacterized protein n=1 Tax=Penicillium expansum TaxID=27334 RepID=A0A0A2ICP0_PENEN|nr:Protein of unknown function DUF2458 [Penicillium expansum]UPX44938.1 hypothetical protein FAC10E3_28 [Penicillium camemberti]KAJ5498817.1 hypothetical protein N7453_007868 [Penicillium expansum]KGO40877.1 Protein of unknown function DUF2458 [Penicillium expansum]KGO50870.1 Protein of unknown function DUF2458 [Penicillium expansum]KGO61688.1 Protein of unknown function DUF2458 [Penicillium expansum]
MGDGSYNASDLNSVLSTLSSLASQGQGSSNQHITTPTHPAKITSSQSKPSQDPRPPQARITRPSTTSTSASDSSTITTWPAALKHVMRTVGQNEETQARIRGVIRSQHRHEQQWFQAREALLKQQQGRPEKQRELDAVLRAIGAPVKEEDGSTEKEFAAEIATYDAKVHRAAVQMGDAIIAELRGLGIPFFTLRKELVQDTPSNIEGAQSRSQMESAGTTSSTVSKSELVKLQQRMLELLEDLCK